MAGFVGIRNQGKYRPNAATHGSLTITAIRTGDAKDRVSTRLLWKSEPAK